MFGAQCVAEGIMQGMEGDEMKRPKRKLWRPREPESKPKVWVPLGARVNLKRSEEEPPDTAYERWEYDPVSGKKIPTGMPKR